MKKVKSDIDKINIEMVSMIQDIKNIPDTVNLSISKSIETEFIKIDKKVESRILIEFERKELEEYRNRSNSIKDLKTHTKKQIISWFVSGLLAMLGGVFVLSLSNKTASQQEVINQYYNEIRELRQEIDNLKPVQPEEQTQLTQP